MRRIGSLGAVASALRKDAPLRVRDAFVAALDRRSGRLTYANAGGNPVLLCRADGSVDELLTTGLPLAIGRDSEYQSHEAQLEPGGTLLLYTDGITEAANREDEQYGLDRLKTCSPAATATLPSVFDAIQADLADFVGSVPTPTIAACWPCDERPRSNVRRLMPRQTSGPAFTRRE